MKRSSLITLLILFLIATSACHHKEFSYNRAVEVEVVFDWKNAPDASPASMALFLFPQQGEVLRYDFTDKKGGLIRVPYGTYEALCLNSDTENISYAHQERKGTFEVTTRTSSLLAGLTGMNTRAENAPMATGTEEERIALSPDMIWTDRTEGFRLKYTPERQKITLYPKQSVRNYTVEIRNAQNLQYTNGISGALSGLAGGLLPGAGHNALTDEPVTIPFEATTKEDQNGQKSIITASFLAFGQKEVEGKKYQLTIYAILADGSKKYYTYDVTDQIKAATDPQNIHIVLEGLPLPKPITNGGGFHPEVEPWQPVEINIDMK